MAEQRAVDPSDEQRHRPDAGPLWNESHYLDFVASDGTLAGYVRIGLYPNLGVTWWTATVVGPDRPLVVSTAYDLPVAGGTGLLLGSGGVEVVEVVHDPLRRVTVQGHAPAAVHRSPADVYTGATGEPSSVGFDLAWTTDGTPYHYGVTTRYEIPCLVEGAVTVGGVRTSVTGHGQRDHSWGERDWWAFGWCWSAARLDDGTRLHLADIRIPGMPVGFGYVQSPDGGMEVIESATVTEELGPEGLPTRATAVGEPGDLRFEVEPLAFGPLLLTATDGRRSRFPRALMAVTTADGRRGTGWIEWNQPEAPPVPQ